MGRSHGHHRADLVIVNGQVSCPPLGSSYCPLTRCGGTTSGNQREDALTMGETRLVRQRKSFEGDSSRPPTNVNPRRVSLSSSSATPVRRRSRRGAHRGPDVHPWLGPDNTNRWWHRMEKSDHKRVGLATSGPGSGRERDRVSSVERRGRALAAPRYLPGRSMRCHHRRGRRSRLGEMPARALARDRRTSR
jgi:hypothetical protein